MDIEQALAKGQMLQVIISNSEGEVLELFYIRREETELPEGEAARNVRDYIERRYETQD